MGVRNNQGAFLTHENDVMKGKCHNPAQAISVAPSEAGAQALGQSSGLSLGLAILSSYYGTGFTKGPLSFHYAGICPVASPPPFSLCQESSNCVIPHLSPHKSSTLLCVIQ